MKKEKILELSRKGTDFECFIPEGTDVNSINQALALFIIDSANYRGIKPATALGEINLWVSQLEENL